MYMYVYFSIIIDWYLLKFIVHVPVCKIKMVNALRILQHIVIVHILPLCKIFEYFLKRKIFAKLPTVSID